MEGLLLKERTSDFLRRTVDATSACLRATKPGGSRRTWNERNDEEGIVPEKVRASVFSA